MYRASRMSLLCCIATPVILYLMAELFDHKYRYIRELGDGGFGRVFLAREEHSDQLVAIKQLKEDRKDRQENIIHEMRMVSKFNHPNIIGYKHHFVQDGQFFIVMEYCAKGSLQDMMERKRVTSTFVWSWMSILTQTLQKVHEKGIVHHDIKPGNILFTEDRIIKISDFGVANTRVGTIPYMSPETFEWDGTSVKDPRVDIYALGVTLLELLTRQNPFVYLSEDEVIGLHDRKEFGIEQLPTWQQEIILKAIAKIPEQRFQSMKEFYEAIQARSVPVVFDKEVLKAGDLAEKAAILLKKKRWARAIGLLEHAEQTFKPNVQVMVTKGRYCLLVARPAEAKSCFEKALLWNPRLDVQKELGWIHLEQKNYPTAISLLSDHLHRHPSDAEAYNLLLQCYYETNRYEIAMELAGLLLENDPLNQCFANNYYICNALHLMGKSVSPYPMPKKGERSENHFLVYNKGVVEENFLSHNFNKEPTLKSKLLFMDYRFHEYKPSSLFCTQSSVGGYEEVENQIPILRFGRSGFEGNDVMVPGGTTISRRHCVIVNYKDDIWIYDLGSTGTYVNGTRITSKIPLIGRNEIAIGDAWYVFTNDRTRLL